LWPRRKSEISLEILQKINSECSLLVSFFCKLKGQNEKSVIPEENESKLPEFGFWPKSIKYNS